MAFRAQTSPSTLSRCHSRSPWLRMELVLAEGATLWPRSSGPLKQCRGHILLLNWQHQSPTMEHSH